jgi:hypothetical protein
MSMLCELPAFYGYDPLLRSKKPFQQTMITVLRDPAKALRAYGVRWCLMHRSLVQLSNSSLLILESTSAFPFLQDFRRLMKSRAVPSLQGIVDVLELDGVAPLCFRMESPGTPVPMQLDCHGLHADLGGTASTSPVVVNFLKYPDLHAYADRTPVPIGSDEWGRMLVRTPAGTHRLDVLYESPWDVAILLALVPFAIGLLMLRGLMVLDKCGSKSLSHDNSTR